MVAGQFFFRPPTDAGRQYAHAIGPFGWANRDAAGDGEVALAEGVDWIGQPFRPQLLRFSGLARIVAGVLYRQLAQALLAFQPALAFGLGVRLVAGVDAEPARGPGECVPEAAAALSFDEAYRIATPVVAKIDAGAAVRAADTDSPEPPSASAAGC
jgi:hypothetical protein